MLVVNEGFVGLIQACDLWLQNQARSGRLFGKVRQLRESSIRPETTREYWDAYAEQHKLRKLAACCEASLESSPEVPLEPGALPHRVLA